MRDGLVIGRPVYRADRARPALVRPSNWGPCLIDTASALPFSLTRQKLGQTSTDRPHHRVGQDRCFT
jgi:hypothetical protein